MSKQAGRFSESANDFLNPQSVTGLSATAVTGLRAFGDGAVSLSWSLPTTSSAATGYRVTTTPETTTTTVTGSTSTTIAGLAGGTSYTFTVIAYNNAGDSPSTTSSSVTPLTVPAAPSAPVATSPNPNQDVVTWSAPSSNGGSAITGYTLISSDGPSYPQSAGTTSATIDETANTSQTYTLIATNALG